MTFGASAEFLAQAFRVAGVEVLARPTLETAVDAAFERLEPGGELLFSPACASFDGFLNFRERALAFRAALGAAAQAAAAR